MTGTLNLAINIIAGVSAVAGLFISLRGYLRSRKSDKMDGRSYFIGMFFILLGIGLANLAEYLGG